MYEPKGLFTANFQVRAWDFDASLKVVDFLTNMGYTIPIG
jgi:hypothetical protein